MPPLLSRLAQNSLNAKPPARRWPATAPLPDASQAHAPRKMINVGGWAGAYDDAPMQIRARHQIGEAGKSFGKAVRSAFGK